MSLRTGHKLHGFIWTQLPIIEDIITRVEDIGMKNLTILNRAQETSYWTHRRTKKIFTT